MRSLLLPSNFHLHKGQLISQGSIHGSDAPTALTRVQRRYVGSQELNNNLWTVISIFSSSKSSKYKSRIPYSLDITTNHQYILEYKFLVPWKSAKEKANFPTTNQTINDMVGKDKKSIPKRHIQIRRYNQPTNTIVHPYAMTFARRIPRQICASHVIPSLAEVVLVMSMVLRRRSKIPTRSA